MAGPQVVALSPLVNHKPMIAMKRLRRLSHTAADRSGALSPAQTRLCRAPTVVMLHCGVVPGCLL